MSAAVLLATTIFASLESLAVNQEPSSGRKGQLLDPPIQKFGSEHDVLRWTRELMNPTKLAWAMAAFSKHAKHFTIQ